jgi:AraC-like DNA-binding protein
MSLFFEERVLDSPVVESLWRFQSESAGQSISIAASHWSFLFARVKGKLFIEMCGPETKATPGTFPADTDVFGINFRPGVFMPHLLPGSLVDKQLELPGASDRAFWLYGSAWQFPEFDDLETFAAWLERDGLLVSDPVVNAALQSQPAKVSTRCLQYRFLESTGLPQRTINQIQRARQAALLLEQGVSIPDTVHRTNYCDQSHLTRSLKHFLGQSPTKVTRVTATVSQ